MNCFRPPLWLVLLVPAPLAAQSPPPEIERLGREIFRELIEIDTSHSGDTTPAAEAGSGQAGEDLVLDLFGHDAFWRLLMIADMRRG